MKIKTWYYIYCIGELAPIGNKAVEVPLRKNEFYINRHNVLMNMTDDAPPGSVVTVPECIEEYLSSPVVVKF